jgi:ABC-type microcin C transport system duplicated ATPase subunit YejF
MDSGRIVEEGMTSDVLTNPQSECTSGLLEAERQIHGL